MTLDCATVAGATDGKAERRRLHHDADVVIVGAGIAGCALAVAFGKQGRSVILLETSLKPPATIRGELLQPGGVAALRILGLAGEQKLSVAILKGGLRIRLLVDVVYGVLDCLEGIDAVSVKGYDVIYYGQEVKIPYPANAGQPGGERPEGRSFHHGRFIGNLRAAAMRTPNVTVVETTATELVKNGWTGQILGVQCSTKGEKDYVRGLLLGPV